MTLSSTLSGRQIDVLKAFLEVTHSTVKWDEVATAAKSSTSKYARDSWAQLKKKLLSGGANVNISDKQYELLKAYVAVMSGSTDWEAVAKKANCKTAKYARDTWRIVKEKLGVDDTVRKSKTGASQNAVAATTGNGAGGKTKGKRGGAGTKRKTATTENDEEADVEAETGSASKKAKITGTDGEEAEEVRSPAPEDGTAVEVAKGADEQVKLEEHVQEEPETASGLTFEFDFPDWKREE